MVNFLASGITRFHINCEGNGRGIARLNQPMEYWPIANKLYRQVFGQLGMALLPGEEIIECTKEEFEAGYDYQLGIDVILRTFDGENTLQEKFLFTDFNTITVEHCQDWMTLEPGDWFKLKAQYYFVGYDPQHNHIFNPWMLLDWARLKRATAQNRVPWKLTANDKSKMGARASLMFAKFNEIPPESIVSSSSRSYSYL